MREEMIVEILPEPGWVRVTMVVRGNAPDSFHVYGAEAAKRVAKFTLMFSSGLLTVASPTMAKMLKHAASLMDDDLPQPDDN